MSKAQKFYDRVRTARIAKARAIQAYDRAAERLRVAETALATFEAKQAQEPAGKYGLGRAIPELRPIISD